MATSQSSDKMMVAAIDFGTTFSGYAFAFKGDFQSDPMRVSGNQWITGSQTGVSLKAPSCALFNPRGQFDSFGFEAEDKYTELALDDHHQDWYYFRRFKMKLYKNQTMTREDVLEDDKGNTLPVMTVFSGIIKYLREHMLNACQQKSFGLSDSEIQWVLTVPAIWSDGAKQFMREAAERGGIPSSQLIIALEPEVAAIYCKHIPVNRSTGEDSKALDVFHSGTKYLILDAGGGTVDITVQEVEGDGSLKELYKANGGDWGGTKIDEAFEEFLQDVVTEGVMYRFRTEHRADYLDLCRDFEIKKRTITPELDQKVTFKIPISLNELYQDMKGTTLRDSVTTAGKYQGKLAWIGDKIRVDAEIAKGLFKVTCNVIVEHLQMIFEQPAVNSTSTILMVGGFSESPMLRAAVKKAFGGMRVIIPQEAGLSVLKGAVQYGFNPRIITSRICKFTYGIETLNKFHEGDPESKRIYISGKCYCNNCFSKHVEIGQSVNLGEATKERNYWPITKRQTQMRLAIYVSEELDPHYITDVSCMYLGELTVDLPDSDKTDERDVGVKLIFGGTELSVEAKVMSTGEITTAAFDFLDQGGARQCQQKM